MFNDGLFYHFPLLQPSLAYLAPGAGKKVEDNHSETSGDTGTSDSGRGGSDEEIHTSMSQSPRDKMMGKDWLMLWSLLSLHKIVSNHVKDYITCTIKPPE